MSQPAITQKSTTPTEPAPIDVGSGAVPAVIMVLDHARLDWVIRAPLANTEIVFIRFTSPGGAVTDANARWALAPGDVLRNPTIGYCGPIYASSESETQKLLVGTFT